jgi:hypothetical protein
MQLRRGRSRVRRALERCLEQMRQSSGADADKQRETMMQPSVMLVIPAWAEPEFIGAVLSEVPPRAAGYSRRTQPEITAEAA